MKHLPTAASVHCQNNINLVKNLQPNTLLIHLIQSCHHIKTKEMLLIRLQIQTEIGYDF